VPAWFAEVVIIAPYLEKKGVLKAFAQEVRLLRGRFGTYELQYMMIFSDYYIAI